jgi:hypothetical protein
MSVKTKTLMLSAVVATLLASGARSDTETSIQTQPVAEPQRWSAGVMLGDPFGLTFKRYLGRDAFDVNLGVAYGPGLRFGGDYLWGLAQLTPGSHVLGLVLYLGAGPFIGSFQHPCGPYFGDRCANGDVYIGGRVPFGLEAIFRQAPVAVGLEMAPAIAFAPGESGFLFDALLTARVLL